MATASPAALFGGGDVVEKATYAMSLSLHRRLDRLGIPNIWDDYGPGGHTWPYWQRDLKRTLPHLMRVFSSPDPAPAKVTYRSIDRRYSVFGWRVRIGRRALEFSRLAGAGRHGFRLSGSGSARVRTAPVLAPGATYLVKVDSAGADEQRIVGADRRGRIRLRVPLGPSNTAQQYTAGASTRVFHTAVDFRRAAPLSR